MTVEDRSRHPCPNARAVQRYAPNFQSRLPAALPSLRYDVYLHKSRSQRFFPRHDSIEVVGQV